MLVKHLKIGNGTVEEIDWNKPEIATDEICVKSAMTGVCTSDIAMMTGEFRELPINMHGHEGLGTIVEIGEDLQQRYDYKIGDFVATRGEPAYADYYNVKFKNFITVPELSPKYIIEPVACGLNLVADTRSIEQVVEYSKTGMLNILIHGSGFMAWCTYHALLLFHYNAQDWNIVVVGSHNKELWSKYNVTLCSEQNVIDSKESFDVIINLKPNPIINFAFDSFGRYLNDNALVIIGCPNQVTTDFSALLWKNSTITLPSPRNDSFYNVMNRAVKSVRYNQIPDVEYFWTKSYNRNTEWKNAFIDGANRPKNYNRGYIVWP